MKRNVKILISLLCWLPFQIMRRVKRLCGAPPEMVILYYHGVPARDRANFARQMDILERIATVARADYCGDGEGAGGRPIVAITFDDAFVSTIDHALPELAARSLPCTIFAPSGYLGRQPGWAMETADDRWETVVDAARLKTLPGPLVTIGAHSVTHPFLTRIAPADARHEIATAGADLADVIGHEVRLFAFPYGDHSDEIVEMCRQHGYQHAFSISPRSTPLTAPAFLRGRVAVAPDDGDLEFFLKATGSYSWMTFASKVKRALRPLSKRGRLAAPGMQTSA